MIAGVIRFHPRVAFLLVLAVARIRNSSKAKSGLRCRRAKMGKSVINKITCLKPSREKKKRSPKMARKAKKEGERKKRSPRNGKKSSRRGQKKIARC